MSVKVDFNTDDIFEYIKNVKTACDNFTKAVAKYTYKNRYKILIESYFQLNKIVSLYNLGNAIK